MGTLGDGFDTTQGSVNDAPATNANLPATVIGVLKGILKNQNTPASALFVGQLAVETTATQFALQSCSWVRFKASLTNTGRIYLGNSGVSASNGFELAPGDDTGWIPLSNLNLLYRSADSSGQRLCYWAL